MIFLRVRPQPAGGSIAIVDGCRKSCFAPEPIFHCRRNVTSIGQRLRDGAELLLVPSKPTAAVDDENRLRRSLLDLHRLIDSGYALTIESSFPPGTQVRVTGGELKGVEGVLVERSGRWRLLVAIDEIGQGVSISVDLLPRNALSIASV